MEYKEFVCAAMEIMNQKEGRNGIQVKEHTAFEKQRKTPSWAADSGGGNEPVSGNLSGRVLREVSEWRNTGADRVGNYSALSNDQGKEQNRCRTFLGSGQVEKEVGNQGDPNREEQGVAEGNSAFGRAGSVTDLLYDFRSSARRNSYDADYKRAYATVESENRRTVRDCNAERDQAASGRILHAFGYDPENNRSGIGDSGSKAEGMSDVCSSNSSRIQGAACMFYPHVLDMIGEILKEDFYILPSSIHEVIILPKSKGIKKKSWT